MLALIGQKKSQSQKFLENGKRIPVTLIDVKGNTVVALRTNEKNKYQAVQLGFSMKKNANKAEVGHAKGAKLEKAPNFLKEIRINDDSDILPEVGTVLNPSEVFTPGDLVDVSGISKGKGFAGGVKRHGFHGGPKTHGQSDRHRAPGSIGQGTTPGRVYKGKRMAGKMGVNNVTVQNLEVVAVTDDGVLLIKGLVPGIINGFIVVKKVGENKNFIPLHKSPEEIEAAQKLEEERLVKESKESSSEKVEVDMKTEETGEKIEDTDSEKVIEVEAKDKNEEKEVKESEAEIEAKEAKTENEAIKVESNLEETKKEDENDGK